MSLKSVSSNDGRYTLTLDQELKYEYEYSDYPTGHTITYLTDNILNETTTLYSFSGVGMGVSGDLYFSSDSKFAVFQKMHNPYEYYSDYYALDVRSKQTYRFVEGIYDDFFIKMSADGSKITWSGIRSVEFVEGVYYFPSIGQFALPKVSGSKIDSYGSGTVNVGDTVSITLDLVGIAQATDPQKITLSLSTGATATYDAARSQIGKSYVCTYTVAADDVSSDLSIKSVNLNGATLLDADGDSIFISNDLSDIKGILKVNGYRGSAGDDNFRGTLGAETFEGGAGNDTYRINNVRDKVIETNGNGNDIIVTTIDYTLSDSVSVEIIRVASSEKFANIALTGNRYAQLLEGNSGNNVLNGRGGADTMIGRAGNDTYYVDNAGDIVLETEGGGVDRVLASTSYALWQDKEIEFLAAADPTSFASLRLAGNSLAQTITGNAGNNEIVGKGGGDTLIGLGGSDTYFVRDQSDRVIEAKGGGIDTVRSSQSYALAAGQEVEVLGFTDEAGTADLSLTGNEFGQTLRGNGGDNRLDGRGGADTLIGRGGDDTYIVDNAGDMVLEGRGGGHDTVLASASFALTAGQEVEVLRLLSPAAKTALNLTGNEFAQSLTGNAGANVLDGKGGADVMTGLAGNDTYLVDNARDAVIEGKGQGTDTVIASVSYTLAAGQEIEALRLASTVGERSLDLTGNAFGQTIVGSAGANVLDGKGGADILTGGRGQDAFLFSTALGAGNIDHITDFTPVDDTIRLSQDIFTALEAGPLTARAFKDIAKAKIDADDRILYDSRNGNLFYDADGSGKAGPVKFAVLDNYAKLTHDDFFVV